MMFEYLCQRQTVTQFEDVGSIGLKKKSTRIRKPAWLVVSKLVGLVGMIIVGLIFIPEKFSFLTQGQAIGAALLVILVYVVFAHFVRPKPNTDNLGVAGFADDKFQYYDDLNRHLLAMDIALGPGRFIASTVIDACTLAGILSEKTQADLDQAELSIAASKSANREEEVTARLAAQRATKGIHTVELDSSRYFTSDSTDSSDQPLQTS